VVTKDVCRIKDPQRGRTKRGLDRTGAVLSSSLHLCFF
jgi:hypothetical protein